MTLKFSVNLGISSASAYLSSTGGGMASTEFYTIQSQFIISNIIIGGILLFLGLAFLFFSVYKFSKETVIK